MGEIAKPAGNQTDQELFGTLFAPVTQNLTFQSAQGQKETFITNMLESQVEGIPKLTYWQHIGLGTDLSPPPYRSARVGSNLYIKLQDAVFLQQISRQNPSQPSVRFTATLESSGDRDICGNLPHASLIVRSMDVNGRLLSIDSSTIEVTSEPTDMEIRLTPPKATTYLLRIPVNVNTDSGRT